MIPPSRLHFDFFHVFRCCLVRPICNLIIAAELDRRISNEIANIPSGRNRVPLINSGKNQPPNGKMPTVPTSTE
jgi:hypothetical protein